MIVSSWIIDCEVVRPLGSPPRLQRGQHKLTPKQKAKQRARTMARYKREGRSIARRMR